MDPKIARALALNKEGNYRRALKHMQRRMKPKQTKQDRELTSADAMTKAIHAIRVANGTSVPTRVARQSQSAQCMREFQTGNVGGIIKWTPTGVKVKTSGRSACSGQDIHESLIRGAIDSVNIDELTATASRDTSGDVRTIAEVDHTKKKERGY